MGAKAAFPGKISKLVALGGLAWVLSLEFFFGQAIAQAAWAGSQPYSLINYPVSDLGNTACGPWPPLGSTIQIAEKMGVYQAYLCSPLHDVMNASFVVAGALILSGLIMARDIWPNRRLARWGIAFVATAGIGKGIVGFVPENISFVMHSIGGLNIPFSDVGILLLGLTVWRELPVIPRFLSIMGIVGELGFVASVAFGLPDIGLAERVADFPPYLWLAYLGACLILAWEKESILSKASLKMPSAHG